MSMFNGLSLEEINELEERRVESLKKAHIDEGEVLHKASQDCQTWQSYFNENITRGKDDFNFAVRDQWTAVERSEFTRLFKPAMTFNKLKDYVRKISGEQRKNKPDLIVRSLTGKASQEQIDLRTDIIRTISYHSQNDLIYQQAFTDALLMGFGCFQIKLEYETPNSFNQIIRYEMINDPTRVYFDPTALKPHKGDGNYFARDYLFTREQFEATYPYILNPVSFLDPNTLMDFQWLTKDTIVVREYEFKEWFPLIIYKLSDGSIIDKKTYESDDFQESLKMKQALAKESSVLNRLIENQIPKIIDERQTQDYKIRSHRAIKDRIIDFHDWPSKYLSGIWLNGDSYYLEGRQYTYSYIRESRDAQKALNYINSEIMAEIKNRRREQWLATSDNIIGNEQQWRNPELQMGALIARPDPKTGAMPIKQQAWDISPGLYQNSMKFTQELREILGFSEQEEMQGKDMSGKSRRERKLEGAMSTYVFNDNFTQAVAQGGRVVNDLLPYLFKEERNMMVVRKDGKSDYITINKKMNDGSMMNPIEHGDFDVEIDTGPSFSVQKEVALEFLQQTLQAYPQAFPLIADLWAKNLDVQFMPQMAERFKSMVPPDILAKENGDAPPPPKPPSPQEQMMQAELKLKQQQLMDRANELQIRQQEHELEKAKMLLDAQKLMSQSKDNERSNRVDLHKADLDFSSKMAKILSDHHLKENEVSSLNQ